jgi:hypothetical protein
MTRYRMACIRPSLARLYYCKPQAGEGCAERWISKPSMSVYLSIYRLQASDIYSSQTAEIGYAAAKLNLYQDFRASGPV